MKMGLVGIGRGGVDLFGLAQDNGKWRAHMNAVMNQRLP
jgi:hypothetical protein